jgi:hypothetical protein
MPYKQFVEQQTEEKLEVSFVPKSEEPVGEAEPRFAESYLSALTQTINEQRAGLDKMKNYYLSSMKTKVIVLVLYLLLAAALSYSVVYGNSIMELHRNMLP